jgi:hypothetical protein
MPDLSLKNFLLRNRFNPKSGVRHLLPGAAKGSLRYFVTTFVFHPDRLQAYQQLILSDQLLSNNGLLNLVMQGDGNLVLYRTQFGRALWASNTAGRPVAYTIMQPDGNLISYSADGLVVWQTATQGHPGAFAVLQDDGNFVVDDAANKPLWASGTVQDFTSPTIQCADALGYQYDETSESWKQLCTNFPCFASIQWPGYSTKVIDTFGGQPLLIGGQPVVIQLWKGTCQKFLGLQNFPGGIGAEVGVYHRVPGRARPTSDSLSFLLAALAAFILGSIESLTDDQLWWAFPELNTRVEFTLTNPVTNRTFFHRRA